MPYIYQLEGYSGSPPLLKRRGIRERERGRERQRESDREKEKKRKGARKPHAV